MVDQVSGRVSSSAAVARAWLVAHRAGPATVAAAGLVTAAVLLGALRLPALESGHTFPLWALFPGTFAVVAATAAKDRAAWVAAAAAVPQVWPRALWLLVLMAVGYLTGAAVGAAAGVPGMAAMTAVLVLVAVPAAAAHMFAGLSVGLAVDAAAVIYGRRLSFIDPVAWLRYEVPGWVWVVAGCIVAALLVRYLRVGDGKRAGRAAWATTAA